MIRGPVAVLLACMASGCASLDLSQYATAQIDAAASAVTSELVYQGIALRSGQVIVSEMDTPVSLLMTLMADDYRPWIHAGVISVEDGEAYVYEAFGRLRPHLGGPPTNAMGGSVRRITLARYLSRQAVAAVYTPTAPVDLQAVAQFARAAYAGKLAFDPWFDTQTANSVYCTEFVAQALEQAGASPVQRSLRNDNTSLEKALAWLGIEAREFILAISLIDKADRVALLSRGYSPAEIDARFIVKRELHRRFTPDQRLGNLFRWSPNGPKLQPQIVAVLEESLAAARERGDVHTLVAEILDRGLGPFDEPGIAISARDRGVENLPGSMGDDIRPNRR